MKKFKVHDKVRTPEGPGLVVGDGDPWMYEVRNTATRACKWWAEGELEFQDKKKGDARDRELAQESDRVRTEAETQLAVERRERERAEREAAGEPEPPPKMTRQQALVKAREARARKKLEREKERIGS